MLADWIFRLSVGKSKLVTKYIPKWTWERSHTKTKHNFGVASVKQSSGTTEKLHNRLCADEIVIVDVRWGTCHSICTIACLFQVVSRPFRFQTGVVFRGKRYRFLYTICALYLTDSIFIWMKWTLNALDVHANEFRWIGFPHALLSKMVTTKRRCIYISKSICTQNKQTEWHWFNYNQKNELLGTVLQVQVFVTSAECTIFRLDE